MTNPNEDSYEDEQSPSRDRNGAFYGSLDNSGVDEEMGGKDKKSRMAFARSARPGLARVAAVRHIDADRAHRIDRNDYTPTSGGPGAWLRWMVLGTSDKTRYTDEETLQRFKKLARMLFLLRKYEDEFGAPEAGDISERKFLLKEVTQRLYSSGAPIWVLGEVLTKTAEGLTGEPALDFFLLPRRAFIYAPGNPPTTVMFKTERGFNIKRMDLIEKITVRLASFASNTQSVTSVKSQMPRPEEMRRLAQEAQLKSFQASAANILEKKSLSTEILDLAEEGVGLFFYTNSAGECKDGHDWLGSKSTDNFWVVKDSEREIFRRLASIEATRSIAESDKDSSKTLYPWWAVIIFRFTASAGACGFWYGGSWVDMFVAGVLAVIVAFVSNTKLTRQERILTEVVAGMLVGIITGLIALAWTEQTCFGAMALGSVLDMMQGFRVIFAVIEIMSRHTVTGGANMLEAIIFTALISYFLKFGQHVAAAMLGQSDENVEFLTCTSSVSHLWYLLLVPMASISWSGLFTPYYDELFLMGMHGVIAFGVYYGMSKTQTSDYLSNFTAAFAVSFSAGVISRFNGRQALGNTVAGLYVLLPGAYLVKALFNTSQDGSFIEQMILNAIIIGLGAWTGTLLCSPTLLGTTRGMLLHTSPKQKHHTGHGAMLYF